MKNIIKNNIGEIITFLSTTIIILIIFKLVGILDSSIIKCDLLTQVYPLVKHIKNIFLTGNSMMYDLNLGLGDNLLGTIYYYLLSPFNILIPFIDDLNIFFLLIIILKSSFSALFFYKYLKYHIKKENINYMIIFSILYALSSYFLSYNFLVEFLDVYMIFPLVLLGIDKIIKEKKHILYIVSIMSIIFCNYYFAYMVAIFSFLYFNYNLLMKKNKKEVIIKNNIHFIIISALSYLTMSFIFLPIISEISSYSHESNTLFGGEQLKIIIDLQKIVEYYVVGNFKHAYLINTDCFYLYTSIITIQLIYFYFINNKIKKREKILTSILFIILLISISFNYANYIWHGLIPPCGFTGRFSFMFIAFTLLICTKSLSNIKRFKTIHYIMPFAIIYSIITIYSIAYYPRLIDIVSLIKITLLYIFIIALFLISKKYNFNIKKYFISFIVITIILLIYSVITKTNFISLTINLLLLFICTFLIKYLNNNHNINIKKFIIAFLIILLPLSLYSITTNIFFLKRITIIKLLLTIIYLIIIKNIPKSKKLSHILVIILIIETILNGYNYLYRFSYKTKPDNSYEKVINYIKEIDKDPFYRVEDNYYKETMNYSILYNFYGIDYFMSTIKEDLIGFFNSLDVKNHLSVENSINYDGSYHLLSSLLNVKYYVETNNYKDVPYTKITSISDYDIYKNEDSLELGYLVNNSLKELNLNNNGLENINNIYKAMVNNENNILDQIPINKINSTTYSFTNTSNRNFYILIELDEKYKKSHLKIYINNNKIENNGNNLIFKINNTYEQDSIINLKIETKKKQIKNISNVYVYYYNEDIYKEDINILKNNQLTITNINNKIEGTIDIDKDGLLFISCNYDKNLEIFVDGKKQEKIKILNTFIGTELEKGKHTIEIKYKPKILYISFIPSTLGLVLLIIILKRKNSI